MQLRWHIKVSLSIKMGPGGVAGLPQWGVRYQQVPLFSWDVHLPVQPRQLKCCSTAEWVVKYFEQITQTPGNRVLKMRPGSSDYRWQQSGQVWWNLKDTEGNRMESVILEGLDGVWVSCLISVGWAEEGDSSSCAWLSHTLFTPPALHEKWLVSHFRTAELCLFRQI